MQYKNCRKGIFRSRPNRFIAHVEVDGVLEICHVKNTGRCKELLVDGAVVYLEEQSGSHRKTKFDLIAVEKWYLLINMDSQAPNQAVEEWLPQSGLFSEITLLKREVRYGSSRFDFYVEADGKRCFLEVKGVTLEENGVARFPDAPTERGTKHLRELESCMSEGYEGYVVFVIQMQPVRCFVPNWERDPVFSETLQQVAAAGVQLLAVDCHVQPDRMELDAFVPICFWGKEESV